MATERPIIFSAPMVRAILSGKKTQTRRAAKADIGEAIEFLGGSSETAVVTVDDFYMKWDESLDDDGKKVRAQWCIWGSEYPEEGCLPIGNGHGNVGDRLWVREACYAKELTDEEAVEYAVQCGDPELPRVGLDGGLYPADAHIRPIENSSDASDRWGVMHNYRGKRGAQVPPIHMPRWASRLTLEVTGVRIERLQDINEADAEAEGVRPVAGAGQIAHFISPYRELWEQINGKDSWSLNPWVWVVSFRINQSGNSGA